METYDDLKWADHKPKQHQHRISDWSLVAFTHDNGEIGLVCGLCETCWHTGFVEVESDEDDRDLSVRELMRAATRWIERQQLPLPLDYCDTPAARLFKRRYTPAARIDTSAQMPLFAMAA